MKPARCIMVINLSLRILTRRGARAEGHAPDAETDAGAIRLVGNKDEDEDEDANRVLVEGEDGNGLFVEGAAAETDATSAALPRCAEGVHVWSMVNLSVLHASTSISCHDNTSSACT